MAVTMIFRLVTPERTLTQEGVLSVTLPTASGEITVLPHHTVLTALLVPGIAKVVSENGEDELAVSGGFIHVEPESGVSVIADSAERGEELDLSVIQAAKKRAEDLMKKRVQLDDQQFAMIAASLERELARERLALKRKARG